MNGQQDDADGDRGVGHVEDWPKRAVGPAVKVEEIDYVSESHPVDQLADRPAECHRDCRAYHQPGLLPALISDYQGNHSNDGDRDEEAVVRPKQAECSARVLGIGEVDNLSDGGYRTVQRELLCDDRFAYLVANRDYDRHGIEQGGPHMLSILDWQSMQKVAYGRASRRASPICLPHRSQTP